MSISKHCSIIRIKFNVFAVYNNLLVEPYYLDFKHLVFLKFKMFCFFDKEEIIKLINAGIILKSLNKDELAYAELKQTITNNIKNKISLMYIIPNNNCNLMCKYCFIGKLNNRNPIYMSYEIAKNAIDKFYNHIKTINIEYGEVVFYGGEPLISFELLKKIVKYSEKKDYKIRFSIVTNATLINEEMISFLKNNNVGIGISIDGPKSINDSNRVFLNSNESVYKRVVANIDRLKKEKVEFGLSITVSEKFLQYQNDFLKWLKELNVKEISYNLMHYNKKNNNWKKYYKNVTKFIIKSNNVLFPEGFKEDRIKRKYFAFYEKDFKYSDCGARGGNQITIKPNGDITICHGFWNTLENEIGNINKIEIKEIFKTKNYKKWNENITINNKKCKYCDSLYICGGGCAMQSKNLFGNELSLDKAFCIHSKYMMKFLLTELYLDGKKIRNI